jgi:nucleoside recognition membrane protein YjiH
VAFFNQTAANDIQFISMILEIIGITLAYIEIRYKPLANRIEARILKEESRIKDFAHTLIENKAFLTLITIFIIVVFFIEIPYMAGLFDRIVPPDWDNVKTIIVWSTFPVIILFFIGLCLIMLGDFVGWLNRFSHGHAIGALGVVVTGCGLVGETYQVLYILINH